MSHAPDFQPKPRRRLTLEEYVDGVLAGDRVTLSRAITLLESARADHQELAQEIIARCLPRAGRSFRLGVTGVPGVGKSTFIEAFGKLVLERGGFTGAPASRLAVLAIDPSSARTHGSILGDKTRMVELSRDERAFIRPSPAVDSLGGVARKTRETIILCEAAGYDTIFIETVGVGQSETAVHSMSDFFLLLMLSGAGDELQGIKRGIMEMADGLAITKADGDNAARARSAAIEYRTALHLFPPAASGQSVNVLTCSAQSGAGLEDLCASLAQYYQATRENGSFARRREEQARFWFYESLQDQLKRDFFADSAVRLRLAELEKSVRAGAVSPFQAAHQLIELYSRSKTK